MADAELGEIVVDIAMNSSPQAIAARAEGEVAADDDESISRPPKRKSKLGNGTDTHAASKVAKTSGSFTAVNADRPNSVAGVSPVVYHTPVALDPPKRTRPTSILIGHWKYSTSNGRPCSPEDSHAVHGVLDVNDKLRVKLLRQTKDGRFFEGNFPAGSGGLWIPHNDVQLEENIANLSSDGVKEYCRVRQSQIDKGETADEMAANQKIAAREALNRAIRYGKKAPLPAMDTSHGVSDMAAPPPEPLTGPRRSSRTGLRRQSNKGAVKRCNSIAVQEVANLEAATSRYGQYEMARREAAAVVNPAAAARSATDTAGRSLFSISDGAQRLDKVWKAQQSSRIRASGEDDVKIYDGVKFERKAMGPFSGKLTSPATLITIDGEDFVEYRVLTRPSFH